MAKSENHNLSLTKNLFLKLAIVLIFMQVNRIIFYLFNAASFVNTSIKDFWVSIYFDLTSVALVFIPFILFSIIPVEKLQANKIYQITTKFLFFISLTFVLTSDLMDVIYFSYTGKRTTSDLFTMLGMGNDFGQQIGSFIKDFWWLLVVYLIEIFLINKLFNKATIKFTSIKWYYSIFEFLVLAAFTIIAGRGGFGFRPISPITAAHYTSSENVPLILNTSFTIVKTFNKEKLEFKNYFSEEEELKYFNPIKSTIPANILPNKTNVVVIILESFGSEWVGAAGAKQSFTPFIDSLANHSLFFENGLANGKKSIEAVPSILAGIPSLMETPFISSPYSTNQIITLPIILKEYGYESMFFHGATNGSMNFDVFASKAGFDKYYGRTEYNNEEHFDGTWGIMDEYFNPWVAKQLSQTKKPFFSTIFTLSSHHPYFIPAKYKNKFPKGPQEICQSIAYADYSLKLFFEEAKKQPWYENTIFVMCADHTSATENPIYNQKVNQFKIPIIYFDPKNRIKSEKSDDFHQQIDILPTLLDLLNVKKTIYTFGNSHFQNTKKEAINYINGSYNYFFNQYMLIFTEERARNLYDAKVKNTIVEDQIKQFKGSLLQQENRVKAMIQRYNRDMILNQTLVNEKDNKLHN